jgi:hypothetical protein
MGPIIPDHAPYHQRNLFVPDALLSGPGSPRDPPIRRTASSRRERTPHALQEEAQRQQADDEQGDAQGQDDNSDEQGEDCNDDAGN